MAAAASERLPGDPLWLLIVAGPGGAKTETVQSLSGARGPRPCGDGSDTGRIVGEKVPSFAVFVDDVVVIIEHRDGELVCA
jgi:hypothetical protein